MRKKLYLFLLLPFIFACSSKPTEANADAPQIETEMNEPKVALIKLVLFESEEGLYGYKNEETGEIVIAAKYQMANDFENGIAQVVGEAGWEIIDQTGKMLFKPFIYDNGPDYFQDGLARFVENNKIGFYNSAGKIVVKPEYDFANPFEQGYAAACKGCQKEMDGEHYTMKGGQWGFIDKTGKEITPFKYKKAKVTEDGKLQVLNGETWETIEK